MEGRGGIAAKGMWCLFLSLAGKVNAAADSQHLLEAQMLIWRKY